MDCMLQWLSSSRSVSTIRRHPPIRRERRGFPVLQSEKNPVVFSEAVNRTQQGDRTQQGIRHRV